MEILPVEIRRLPGVGVEIRWSDGASHQLSNHLLRTQCPCAECREKRGDGESHARPLTARPKKPSMLRVVEHEAKEELQLDRIWGVGNYALGIAWADGHASGIYTFTYLRELAMQ